MPNSVERKNIPIITLVERIYSCELMVSLVNDLRYTEKCNLCDGHKVKEIHFLKNLPLVRWIWPTEILFQTPDQLSSKSS